MNPSTKKSIKDFIINLILSLPIAFLLAFTICSLTPYTNFLSAALVLLSPILLYFKYRKWSPILIFILTVIVFCFVGNLTNKFTLLWIYISLLSAIFSTLFFQLLLRKIFLKITFFITFLIFIILSLSVEICRIYFYDPCSRVFCDSLDGNCCHEPLETREKCITGLDYILNSSKAKYTDAFSRTYDNSTFLEKIQETTKEIKNNIEKDQKRKKASENNIKKAPISYTERPVQHEKIKSVFMHSK